MTQLFPMLYVRRQCGVGGWQEAAFKAGKANRLVERDKKEWSDYRLGGSSKHIEMLQPVPPTRPVPRTQTASHAVLVTSFSVPGERNVII